MFFMFNPFLYNEPTEEECTVCSEESAEEHGEGQKILRREVHKVCEVTSIVYLAEQ